MESNGFPFKLPSQMQMDAYREMQNEAFYDLADQCERCEALYISDDGCPYCLSRD